MGRTAKPAPIRPPNPLRGLKPIRPPPAALVRGAQQGAAKAKARRLCPNKQCPNPKIEDGTCITCGTIVDDANIVAEVQFGENSSGAAVVQGSFVSADQGAAKSLGPAFRRAGGNEHDREKTLREGKRIMMGFAAEHKLSENHITAGMQIFKMACMINFIQGRRMNMVAAACLYTACRRERPCRVMLIDFADSCQVNVFKLGHCFKQLHAKVTLGEVLPILPEDLIYRFAVKLEFGLETDKVAETAVRLVTRMQRDWMIMGRRPSGICGACLILAARIHNFRRTVTEVVYIVKVTTATLQKRLDEFQYTASSEMTVESFLRSDFLESAHDPPSFYQKTEAYLSQKKTRKRKKPYDLEDSEQDPPNPSNTTTATTDGDVPMQSIETGEHQSGTEQGLMLPPPRPQLAAPHIPIDPAILEADEDTEADAVLTDLVARHEPAASIPPEETTTTTSTKEKTPTSGRGRGRPVPSAVDENWLRDEDVLESEMTEIVNDPQSIEHSIAFATAAARALQHLQLAAALEPQRDVPMTAEIEEGEFANDPEVVNCLLSEEETKIKECIWVNNNKEWLRDQQQKEFNKKMAALNPKRTRNRTKQARMGEGQESAASSPQEAAMGVLKNRAFSKRINYEAIAGMFDNNATSILGSAATSRVTSRANSVAPSEVGSQSVAGSEAEESIDEREGVVGSAKANEITEHLSDAGDSPFEEDEQVGEDPDDNWQSAFAREDEADDF